MKVYLTSNQATADIGIGISSRETTVMNLGDAVSPMSLHPGGSPMSMSMVSGLSGQLTAGLHPSSLNVLSIAMEGAMKSILLADDVGRAWLA